VSLAASVSAGRVEELDELVLEAFARVRAALPRVRARLVVVGAPDDEKPDAFRPATDAARFGLGDAVIFTGHRSDVADLYASFDVFCLPSHREGFPRSPMEASACGVAVVATDIRGCREAVLPDESGLIVPLQSPDALAAVLDDDALRARLGQGGLRLARARFDERVVFETILQGYDRVLRAKGIDPPARLPFRPDADSDRARDGEAAA
jgi:glycosyltransferase involved in cell wall biosynthesis